MIPARSSGELAGLLKLHRKVVKAKHSHLFFTKPGFTEGLQTSLKYMLKQRIDQSL